MGVSTSIFMKDEKDVDAVMFSNPEVNSEYNDSLNNNVVYEKVSFSELLTKLNKHIESYEQSKNITDLQNAIDTFGDIPKKAKSLKNSTIKNSKEVLDAFNKIRSYCYNLDSKSKQETYVIKFAESIFLGWKYDKNITHYRDKFLTEGLIKYNVNKLSNIQSRLDYLEYVTQFYNKYGDPYPELDFIPEIALPEKPSPDKDNNSNNNNNSNNSSNNNNNNNNSNNNNSNNNNNNSNSNSNSNNNSSNNTSSSNDSTETTISKFEKNGNKCYKVEEIYKDGVKVNTKKTLADKSDYSQCGIYDYVNFGSGALKPTVDVDKDYLHVDQNNDSEYYAYYTVSKGDKAPYYFNSGLRASSIDKSLTYNQLKDILYQISIKSNGFTVKSNNKSLFVIEGKTIVLNKNKKSQYSQSEVENLLNNYSNIGIKIMKSSEKAHSLEEYNKENVNKNYITNIVVDEVKINNTNGIAWVDANEIVKVSIKDIAEILGADTAVKDGKLIITKDKNEIVIENNKKDYYINNQKSSFLTNVYKSKNNFISELSEIPQILGYEANFDLEENKLEFVKIK